MYLVVVVFLGVIVDGQGIVQELVVYVIECEVVFVEFDFVVGVIDGWQFWQQVDVIVGEVEGFLCVGIDGMVQWYLEFQVQMCFVGGGVVFYDVVGLVCYWVLVDVLQEDWYGVIGNVIDFQYGIM